MGASYILGSGISETAATTFKSFRVGEMALWVKVLVTKADTQDLPSGGRRDLVLTGCLLTFVCMPRHTLPLPD